MDQSLKRLNELAADHAEAELLNCCGSTEWAKRMTRARPFASADQLRTQADEIWWSLSEREWLEAFRAHPKIGEKKAATTQSALARNWSAREQSGIAGAPRRIVDELVDLNREYQDRFGFIFIVCASGKSSDEMLQLLRSRLHNPPKSELRIAAEEQRKITRLRLERLLETPVS